MAKAFFTVILNLVQSLLNIILYPVNLLVEALFPQTILDSISSFTTFVNNYVGNIIAFFSSLFPPIFRSLVMLALTFMIGYYAFVWTYSAIIKIWNVIQKIKFW